MEALLSRQAQLLVERLANERVGESIARVASTGYLEDELRLERLLDRRDELLFADRRHPLEPPEIEFPAEDGGARERLVASRREPREAASDDLANSFRDAHLLDRFSPARPPAIAAIERTGLEEVANHLFDEERVAFRLALQGFR